MRFTILHPSRRPHKANETVCKWFNRYDNKSADDIHYMLSVDTDDPGVNEYEEHSRMWIIKNPNRSAVDAINIAAERAPRFSHDILIVVSDDTDCPEGWNNILREAIGNRKDFLLKVNHGLANSVVTMPVMDRKFYNRTGYIYYPEYKHLYCDTDLTERAKRLGRLIVRNDILFEHLHPEKTGEPKDALYLKNDATYHQGKELFQQRQKINFGL